MIFANIKRGVQLGLIYNYYPKVAGIIRSLLHKKMAKMQYAHFDYCIQRVTKRLEKGRVSEGVDLWTLILRQEEKGKEGITRREMDANASLCRYHLRMILR